MAKITMSAGRASPPTRPARAARLPRGEMAPPHSPHSARRNLDDRVHDALREQIASGRIHSGERLQADALASQLGVDRMHVVRALKQLTREGMVDRLSHKGIYVRLLSRQEMTELFLVRERLEPLAARLAALRISPAETARLTAMFRRCSGTSSPNLVRRYILADRRFHQRLVAIAGNEYLTRAMDATNAMVFAFREGLVRPPSETISEHLAILQALRQRDPDASEAAMRLHLRRSVQRLEADVAAGKKAPVPRGR